MTGPFRTSVGHAFGRTAMPLAAYYGVTLALPLANGAGRSGTAFVQHAVIVLAVPPLLVLLICAIHAMGQAAARFAVLLQGPDARVDLDLGYRSHQPGQGQDS